MAARLSEPEPEEVTVCTLIISSEVLLQGSLSVFRLAEVLHSIFPASVPCFKT